MSDAGNGERLRLERALGGRYEILRLIGQGGMSAVYLAWEYKLDRQVAIKVLDQSLESQVEHRERFRREARIAAALAHPNIVPVYAFDRVAEVTFTVMQYVNGESLADRIAREGLLDPGYVARVVADLADALDSVHRVGVVHRDIKPENILLETGSRRPLLTDFGVALVGTSDHSRSEISKALGTPWFMSPEQILGRHECDGRSDLYSLGLVGFLMLTGRLPFAGLTAQAVAAQHVAADPPLVRDLAPQAPEVLARVIDRCLEKDPRRRWPDGQRLAHELRSAAPGSSRRDSWFARHGARWTRGLGLAVRRLLENHQ